MTDILIDRLYKFRRKKQFVKQQLDEIDSVWHEDGHITGPLLDEVTSFMKDRYSRLARIVGKIERRLGPDHPDVRPIEGFDEGGEG